MQRCRGCLEAERLYSSSLVRHMLVFESQRSMSTRGYLDGARGGCTCSTVMNMRRPIIKE